MGGGPDGSGDRFQVGLRDLALAVLGSAFVLDVARRSRVAWGGGPPDIAHALGLAVLGLAVALALVVATRRSRRLGVGGDPVARGWALAWRAAAVGWLAFSVAEAAWILQGDGVGMATTPLGPTVTQARLDVVPACVTLGMIGLILAASPARSRRSGPGPSRPRAAWPSVVWAGLAGVAILAAGYVALPYLLLLALEAVSNAMIRTPMVPRASLHARMVRAGIEASAVGLACLATASWVAEDLRAAARDPGAARSPLSWAGVLARLATAVATAIGGLYLVLVTLPNVHPRLAEGLWMIVEPTLAATIALAFAGLAAGIAARGSAALAGAVDLEATGPLAAPRAWPRRLIAAAGCLVAAEVIAAAVFQIRCGVDAARPWYVPLGLQDWSDLIGRPSAWIARPPTAFGSNSPLDRPGDLLILLAAPWIIVRLFPLIAGGTAGPPPALDLIAADPLARRRFLGTWAALTAVLLAAFPTFLLTGLALLHESLRRGAW